MIIRSILAAAALTAAALPSLAQAFLDDIVATPEKAGGIYYAYPVDESLNTPAPKGYKPFYISHYGRHGSRYLISDRDYTGVNDLFHQADQAGALTKLGKDVMARLDTIWLEAEGRGGELTPLGVRQHQGIGRRMAEAFPEAFAGTDAQVTAASTTVMRCAHSMYSLLEGLKSRFPQLEIPRESSNRNMHYLNYHSPESGPYSSDKGEWYLDWKKFRQEKTAPDRLVNSLFCDSTFIRRHVDPVELMWGLYWIAVDLQNMETAVDLFDIFTPQELFDLWQVFNFNFYACNSNYPGAEGLHVDNAKNLLRNIVETADAYIADGKHGATLRFGHDGNLIPLAALMRLQGTYAPESNPYELHKVYSDFKISPMAGNIQMIFFNDKKGDILVKFMLNEREIAIPATTDLFPFYRWEDARQVLMQAVETPFAQLPEPIAL